MEVKINKKIIDQLISTFKSFGFIENEKSTTLHVAPLDLEIFRRLLLFTFSVMELQNQIVRTIKVNAEHLMLFRYYGRDLYDESTLRERYSVNRCGYFQSASMILDNTIDTIILSTEETVLTRQDTTATEETEETSSN